MNASCKILLCSWMFCMLLACESDTRKGSAEDIARGSCPPVGDLSVVELDLFGQAPACQISGTLSESATLPNTRIWFLDGQLIIDGGTTSDIRLTVESGTDVRGSTGDSIYVTSGSGLFAVGSKISPISFGANRDGASFSSNFDDPGGGLWGGIVIEDSLATDARTRMEYVVISDAGEDVLINSTTYNNNLTLIGDHSSTSLHFVQSHDSAQDGIRLVGEMNNQNIARMDWVLITGAGRDGISYKYFSGLLKNTLVIHRQGVFNSLNNTGGRAGLFASGTNSLPLIINLTLAGQDNTVVPVLSGVGESGIILDEDVNGIRIANTLIVNFRNSCTDLLDNANISMAVFNNGLTSSFVDGLFCVNDFDAGDDWFVRTDADNNNGGDNNPNNFPLIAAINTNDNGVNYFAGMNVGVNFFDDSSSTTSFTSRWFVESINNSVEIFDNGLLGSGSTNRLNVYQEGDTDNSGSGVPDITTDDIDALPLLNDSDFGSVDGFPDDLSDPGDSRGYDLTHVGAILSSNGASSTDDVNNPDVGDQFDGWTVQSGFLTVTIDGFDPIVSPP